MAKTGLKKWFAEEWVDISRKKKTDHTRRVAARKQAARVIPSACRKLRPIA